MCIHAGLDGKRLLPTLISSSRDGSVIAVHKPAGLPFHSINGQIGLLGMLRSEPGVLVNQLAARNSACIEPFLTSSGINHIHASMKCTSSSSVDVGPRLYAVHRLDTPTSGLVLFATSSHTAGLLAKAFRERRVHKYYIALSNRKPKKKQGSVIGDMAKSRRSAWKLLPKGGGHGPPDNPAITRFWSMSLPEVQPGLRLYLLKPETGRTHQLRVAMKSLGAAILGDPLYSRSSSGGGSGSGSNGGSNDLSSNSSGEAAAMGLDSSSIVPACWQADRMYLHAAALRIQLPSGDWFQVVDHALGGILFQHEKTVQAYQQLLPQAYADEYGEWLSHLKLLSSTTEV